MQYCFKLFYTQTHIHTPNKHTGEERVRASEREFNSLLVVSFLVYLLLHKDYFYPIASCEGHKMYNVQLKINEDIQLLL